MEKVEIDRFATHEYRCPFCSKAVKLSRFGEGWIGKCCNKIVYNASKPYVEAKKKEVIHEQSAIDR
jgi:ribosomal protein L37AE/L43A